MKFERLSPGFGSSRGTKRHRNNLSHICIIITRNRLPRQAGVTSHTSHPPWIRPCTRTGRRETSVAETVACAWNDADPLRRGPKLRAAISCRHGRIIQPEGGLGPSLILGHSMGDCTRSSAIAEAPRDASCQLKSCQLPRNSAETTYTTSPDQIDGMKLEI